MYGIISEGTLLGTEGTFTLPSYKQGLRFGNKCYGIDHLHSISIIFGRQEATNEILTSQPQTSIDREACLII